MTGSIWLKAGDTIRDWNGKEVVWKVTKAYIKDEQRHFWLFCPATGANRSMTYFGLVRMFANGRT